MSTSLCFNEVQLSPINHDNQTWIQARQLACALGYKDERSVHKIYERNKDEFSPMMSTVVNLTTGMTEIPTRIFSLRGCHLIAMFARTPVAKAFRRWVLDVLDRMNQEQPQIPSASLTPSTPADRKPLDKLVKVWASQARIPHAQAWAQVNAHFNLGSVTELPTQWLPDAIAWVQEKIDAMPKALPKAAPQTPEACPISPRTSLEEIENRLTALCQYILRERKSIYVDLLNQFCTIHTASFSSADIVCSSVSGALFHMIEECLGSCSDAPLRHSNPCKLVRDIKAMLER